MSVWQNLNELSKTDGAKEMINNSMAKSKKKLIIKSSVLFIGSVLIVWFYTGLCKATLRVATYSVDLNDQNEVLVNIPELGHLECGFILEDFKCTDHEEVNISFSLRCLKTGEILDLPYYHPKLSVDSNGRNNYIIYGGRDIPPGLYILTLHPTGISLKDAKFLIHLVYNLMGKPLFNTYKTNYTKEEIFPKYKIYGHQKTIDEQEADFPE